MVYKWINTKQYEEKGKSLDPGYVEGKRKKKHKKVTAEEIFEGEW